MSNIVICGAMRHLDVMKAWYNKLKQAGHNVWMPTNFDTHKYEDIAIELQKITRPFHFLKIKNLRRGEKNILLICNKDGYIGGGTFAEIMYAYALNSVHDYKIEIIAIEPIKKDLIFWEELAVVPIKILGKDTMLVVED